MSDRPFKIQMNQAGAILKIENSTLDRFNIIPDYIELEKASYPKMQVNAGEPWTDIDPPPEDYVEKVVDDTLEEDVYYTFYCNSYIQDDDTLDLSGNGSQENPWRNFFHALLCIEEWIKVSCCNKTKFRLLVSGEVAGYYKK
jgi:hypothetical protein